MSVPGKENRQKVEIKRKNQRVDLKRLTAKIKILYRANDSVFSVFGFYSS